jgi:drug/metabolite transporter (DMT)-like permease
MLVALCLLWGVTWPLMKIALSDIPPLSMRTLTAGLGALTLLVICLIARRPLHLPARMWLPVFVTSLLSIGAFSLLSAYAQMTAATSRVTILIYTMPIWAVLMAWLMLGERPTSRQGVAVILCIVGLAILIYPLAPAGCAAGSAAGACVGGELGGRHCLCQMEAAGARSLGFRLLASRDGFRRYRRKPVFGRWPA